MQSKHILFTITLLFFTLFIHAQDKYEFMAICYIPSAKEITLSINGKQLLTEEVIVSVKGEASYQNVNPLFKKVNEFQDKGWEVMNFNNTNLGQYANEEYFAYLRKKKVQ